MPSLCDELICLLIPPQELRDEEGKPYSPKEWSLEQNEDGEVVLSPRRTIAKRNEEIVEIGDSSDDDDDDEDYIKSNYPCLVSMLSTKSDFGGEVNESCEWGFVASKYEKLFSGI